MKVDCLLTFLFEFDFASLCTRSLPLFSPHSVVDTRSFIGKQTRGKGCLSFVQREGPGFPTLQKLIDVAVAPRWFSRLPTT